MLEDETVKDILVECGANLNDLKQELQNFLNEDSNFSLLSEDEIQDLNRKQFGNDQLREIAKENGIFYQPEISLSLQRVIQRPLFTSRVLERNRSVPLIFWLQCLVKKNLMQPTF